MFDVIAITIGGFILFAVLYLAVRLLVGIGSRRVDNTVSVESQIVASQQARSAELQDLLWRIRSYPESQRAALWQRYLDLEAYDKTMRVQERAQIAARGGRPAKAADVEPEPRRVLKARRAR